MPRASRRAEEQTKTGNTICSAKEVFPKNNVTWMFIMTLMTTLMMT